jgi:hypothetical protein
VIDTQIRTPQFYRRQTPPMQCALKNTSSPTPLDRRLIWISPDWCAAHVSSGFFCVVFFVEESDLLL